ncbi:TIGR03086 family protein [Streptomyces sp. SID5785]|uniref:TIGR03086 family metal-binding protein n=1 Tax=Streptomyces sp. SID5785 TaxID=2690309 RepID=UPI0013619AF1|nr:TIGR03086 family metal-binding protein [Streptomyces sp. SID5785]MZD08108.1 TIGR03086 family protein [Streptomyces sp. SID5785]MZD10152.1 TIGR03086 family protein [Streptomyces sp. SID5785]
MDTELRRENLHPSLTECAAESARVAAGVGPERLGAPSGCAGWDVRTLVNHWVLHGAHGLEHRALRTPLPDALTARDFTADPGWAADFAARLDIAVAAWAGPAVWEGEIDLGFARQAAPEVASLLLLELALHGWDVARATGQDFKVSDATGRLVLDVVTDNAATYRQYEGFAEAVPPADGATAFTRALALSGRDPR